MQVVIASSMQRPQAACVQLTCGPATPTWVLRRTKRTRQRLADIKDLCRNASAPAFQSTTHRFSWTQFSCTSNKVILVKAIETGLLCIVSQPRPNPSIKLTSKRSRFRRVARWSHTVILANYLIQARIRGRISCTEKSTRDSLYLFIISSESPISWTATPTTI